MAGAYAPLVAKYCPDVGAVSAELTAVLVTAAIVAPRIGKPRLKKRAEVADGDTDGGV
jgi:hypothetical protein